MTKKGISALCFFIGVLLSADVFHHLATTNATAAVYHVSHCKQVRFLVSAGVVDAPSARLEAVSQAAYR